MRIALLTRSYPRAGDLYKYPFVHRRVLAYGAAGHEVHVIQIGAEEDRHSHEGVECLTLPLGQIAASVEAFAPDVVAFHGPDEGNWAAAESLGGRWPVVLWLHGSEIPEIFRVKSHALADAATRAAALAGVERRVAFWRSLSANWPSWLSITFVSHTAAAMMEADLDGNRMPAQRVNAIPNPIDTDLFRYRIKTAVDRHRILSLRPYDSFCYGNDLAVSAALALRGRADFSDLSFTFVGDGPMFDETLAPLRGLPNVSIERRFLTQTEIAAMHARHGQFLVPTRLDTQGVSRDEAMASGLVPVTNAVCAIPEYTDAACAGLAEAEDHVGLAREISAMIDNPALFLSRSAAAAERVRHESGHEVVIPRELAWMERCRDAAA